MEVIATGSVPGTQTCECENHSPAYHRKHIQILHKLTGLGGNVIYKYSLLEDSHYIVGCRGISQSDCDSVIAVWKVHNKGTVRRRNEIPF